MPTPKFRRIAIVGVGLLGGSLGLAILRRQLAAEVVGIGRNPARLAAAKRVKAITAGTTVLKKGLAGSDLAIVCTPVESIADTVRRIADVAEQPILITDVGSTKQAITTELDRLQQSEAWPNRARFVGSHPIAGNEKSGVEHGSADLFAGKAVVITPSATTKPADVSAIKRFWIALDARVTILSPEEHDLAMAAISHLPHLLASAIAASTPERYLALSGAGWQDTTRIAAGDPALWQQILLSNRQNLLVNLASFEQGLAAFASALRSNDPTALKRLLADGKKIRDAANGNGRKKPE
jgi:prephenate dehydrogenase